MTFVQRLRMVAALSLGPVVATAFARFAYALVLPAMRAELGLDYAQAGALNTANALGYLVGALLLSGIGIPMLLALAGEDAWREAWLLVGGVSVLLATIAIRGARAVEEPPRTARGRRWPIAAFAPALVSYSLFGVGYIAYMTFVVAWMRSHGASTLEVAFTWATLGAATMVAPLAWRVPRARWHASRTLAASATVIAIGAVIPLLDTSPVAMVSSALLFGGAMFTVPTAITDLVKTSLPRATWGSAVAVFTVSFAAGQAVGPVFTGWLSDAFHALDAGLAASVAILLAAGAAALAQRARTTVRAPAALRAAD
jgi:predicted MFS family arabinose efflux permease